MCRLFGFRSIIQSQVHQSLLDADNALIEQSHKHPDGWGVAYYAAGAPHVIKSEKSALEDHLFTKVSGIVSSETVIAHIRKATEGKLNVLNTHPFQHGNWTFAHNGNIKNFNEFKDEIKVRIAPGLRRYILGDTDSELIFFFLLTHISEKYPLTKSDICSDSLAKQVRKAINELIDIIGPYSEIDNAGPAETYISFIITNGVTMLAHHGGKHLYFSTYKTECPEANSCPSFTVECHHPTKTGYINHLLFTSEPLEGNNVWIQMERGELIGVDWQMKLHRYPRP